MPFLNNAFFRLQSSVVGPLLACWDRDCLTWEMGQTEWTLRPDLRPTLSTKGTTKVPLGTNGFRLYGGSDTHHPTLAANTLQDFTKSSTLTGKWTVQASVPYRALSPGIAIAATATVIFGGVREPGRSERSRETWVQSNVHSAWQREQDMPIAMSGVATDVYKSEINDKKAEKNYP